MFRESNAALIFIPHSSCHSPSNNTDTALTTPKLRDMKSSIDNKCPRAASHLKTKAKKNALMEDRFAQIETENRLLLEKMSHIMRVCFLIICQSPCLASHTSM